MKSWYIIAYDIRRPKRLRRLHYYLRKRATALQNSVFLIKADDKYLKHLSKTIQSIADGSEDDIRIYPIHHPDTLWAAGKQVNALKGLYIGSRNKAKKTKRFNWLRKLLVQ